MDTLEMIKELLLFKGDKRLSILPIIHFGNGKLGRTYHPHINNGIIDYSIQVEALFLINQLFFVNPFDDYLSCPVLIDTNKEIVNTIDGEVIEKTYECYEEWYEQINKCGLEYVRKNKILPLDNCKHIQWY